jgi:DNA-directed RNA polymerase subunit H (RpoH/RPB5)
MFSDIKFVIFFVLTQPHKEMNANCTHLPFARWGDRFHQLAVIKSIQLMMMQVRGFELSEEEKTWLYLYDDMDRKTQKANEIIRKLKEDATYLNAVYEREVKVMMDKEDVLVYKKTCDTTDNDVCVDEDVEMNVDDDDEQRPVEEYVDDGDSDDGDEKIKVSDDENELYLGTKSGPVRYHTIREIVDVRFFLSVTPRIQKEINDYQAEHLRLLTTEPNIRRTIIIVTDYDKSVSDLVKKTKSSFEIEWFPLFALCYDPTVHRLASYYHLLSDKEEISLFRTAFVDENTGEDFFNTKTVVKKNLPIIHVQDVVSMFLGARNGNVVKIVTDHEYDGACIDSILEYRRVRDPRIGDDNDTNDHLLHNSNMDVLLTREGDEANGEDSDADDDVDADHDDDGQDVDDLIDEEGDGGYM